MDIDRKWSMSCYIPIINIVTCLITAVRRVESKFCRFHYRQGLILFAFWFLTILISFINQTLSLMLWGIVLLLHGTGIYVVYYKKLTKIPILGQLAVMIPEFYIFTLLTGKNPESSWSEEQKEENKSGY
ncbi:hypothetical protein GF366_00875 [Candidatus Peregrinibacteria bacterium]|nr:hypothetical protein [Candidatus Peregrinibacteria bacterium]